MFGFVSGRGIRQNAESHVQKRTVINIDLEDFFSQVHFGRIYGALQSKPYCLSKEVAQAIAQISCFKGVLPQGAPTSPILTNIVCRSLDNCLIQLARENRCSFSRYADDITFSTYSGNIPSDIVYTDDTGLVIGEKLSNLLSSNGFIANRKKISIYNNSCRQQVTGLTVNDKVNVPRSYIRKLRVILYRCIKNGVYCTVKEYVKLGLCSSKRILDIIDDEKKKDDVETWFLSVLRGKLLYLKSIRGNNDLLYLSYAEQYNQIANSDCFDVSFLENTRKQIEDNIYLIESLDEGNQGSAFYLDGIGIITSYHVIENGSLFSVSKYYKNKPKQKIADFSSDGKFIFKDHDIDYVVLPFKDYQGIPYKIGDSQILKTGEAVITIGYPDHFEGNSINKQRCEITSSIKYHGGIMYTIKGIIAHGYSGGIVLNEKNEVVGLIKGGVIDANDAERENKQGFVPINVIIESIEQQKTNAASE